MGRARCAVALAALAAAGLRVGPARGQACCTATAASDLSVVGRCESAVIAARVGWEAAAGSFDGDGRYAPLTGMAAHDVVWTVGAGTRVLTRSLQVHGALPVRLQYRRYGDGPGETAVGLGDASLALRWTALEDPMTGLAGEGADRLVPFVDLFAGVKAPTGRAPEDARTATGADITGDGAWWVSGGARVAKFLSPAHVANIQVHYARAVPRDIRTPDATRRSVEHAPGDELALQAGWLYIHDLLWSGGLTADLTLRGAAREDGRAVAGGEHRRLRLTAHVTRMIALPDWEVTVGLTFEPWWDGAGRNVPFAGPGVGLALRRSWN